MLNSNSARRLACDTIVWLPIKIRSILKSDDVCLVHDYLSRFRDPPLLRERWRLKYQIRPSILSVSVLSTPGMSLAMRRVVKADLQVLLLVKKLLATNPFESWSPLYLCHREDQF